MVKDQQKIEEKRKVNKMIKSGQITIEAKIQPDGVLYGQLEEYSKFYCYLERKLFNELKSAEINSDLRKQLKRKYIAEHRIPARLFNALWNEVRGSIQGLTTLHKLNISTYKSQLSKIQKQMKALKKSLSKETLTSVKREKKKLSYHSKHQKTLRLQKKIEKPFELKCVYGSKAFYKSQWTNPIYTENHSLWLKDWQRRRNCHMVFVGSKDESNGNQLCQFTGESLKLRLPDSFEKGKYLTVPVSFSSTSEKKNAQYYNYFHEAYKNKGALSYRFTKRENGLWYVLCSFEISNEIQKTYNGAIGLDFNYDLISTATLDKSGNLTSFKDYKYISEDSSTNHNKAVISKIVNEIVTIAKQENRLISIEDLNLNKCKQTQNKTTNRKVSLMQYALFKNLLNTRCIKEGVKLTIVNPAYTSVIGKHKYQQYYGVSVHTSAALVVGRRGLRIKDKVPRQICSVLQSGEADKWETIYRHKHHWSHWNFVNKNLIKCLEEISSNSIQGTALNENKLRLRFNPDMYVVPDQVTYEFIRLYKFK